MVIEWISNSGRYSRIESWGSTEMLHGSIKNQHTSDVNFASKIIDDYQFREAEYRGIFLIQDCVSFLHKNVVKVYI